MTSTLAFNNSWESVEESSLEAKYKIIKDVHGHVYSLIKRGDEWETVPPGLFGLFYPVSKNSDMRGVFSSIEEFLKDITETSHFKEAWSTSVSDTTFSNILQCMSEETTSNTHTLDNVKVFTKLYIACYPAIVHLEPNSVNNIYYDGFYGPVQGFSTYHKYHSSLNLKELTKSVFAVWRKDLAKLITSINLEFLEIFYLFHSTGVLFPEDFLELNLKKNNRLAIDVYSSNNLSKLSVLPRSVLKRLLKELIFEEVNSTLIEDTTDLVEIVGKSKKFRGCKTWSEVHDVAMKLAPDINFVEEIVVGKTIRKINELKCGDLSFKVMFNSKDFIRVGVLLSICIGRGAYFKKSLNGDSYCFSIFKDRELYGALELLKIGKSWKVGQISGESNSRLDEHDFILDTLNSFVEENFSKNTEEVVSTEFSEINAILDNAGLLPV